MDNSVTNALCFGSSTIHILSSLGYVDSVKRLLERSGDGLRAGELKDPSGNTALHYAVWAGKLNVVRLLLSHCRPGIRGQSGWTPLHVACQVGHIDIAKLLAATGNVDFTEKDEDGRTCLHFAVYSGNLLLVRWLIEVKHCNPVESCKYGNTALHMAAYSDRLSILDYLIDERRCDPQNKAGPFGWTPVHVASQQGHLQVLKSLVNQRNVNASVVDGNDNTPLHYAAGAGHIDSVRFLADGSKRSAEQRNHNGDSPLHLACVGVHMSVVQYLVNQCRVSITVRNNDGSTPLDIALASQHRDIANILRKALHSLGNIYDTTPTKVARHDERRGNGPQGTVRGSASHNGMEARSLLPPSSAPIRSSRSASNLATTRSLSNVMPQSQVQSSTPASILQTTPNRSVLSSSSPITSTTVSSNLTTTHLLAQSPGNSTASAAMLQTPPNRSVLPSSSSPIRNTTASSNLTTTLSLAQSSGDSTTSSTMLRTVPNRSASDTGNSHSTTAPDVTPQEEDIGSFLPISFQRTLLPFIRKKAVSTGLVLGNGTYGSVEEVKIGNNIYAGKKFRVTQRESFLHRLSSEIDILSNLKHPNIVRYCGICRLSGCNIPVLLMERLQTDLHTYLFDSSHPPLQLQQKRSILCDVACGLAYLHCQTFKSVVVHRDLTSKNVLLDDSLTAKVSDFGNARMIDPNTHCGRLETMTARPGTIEYMPPEAFERNKYTTKLDIFSFGHLALFTITATTQQADKSCKLLPPTYSVTDERGTRIQPRNELQRRKKFTAKLLRAVGESDPLVSLLYQCLSNNPDDRPTSDTLYNELQKMVPSNSTQRITNQLKMSDMQEILSYLQDLTDEHIHGLGLALGMNPTTLNNLRPAQNFRYEVISAWIRRQDGVKQATWESLVKALTDPSVRQNGLAEKIIKDSKIP